ncbi:MAG: carbohydrate ABC transporter permease [Acholeplasma sp.]|jgi:multiple sugar transport system permease protein|nr:MAG: carbohydrate ABC transporter permease [Acholeplasma sp.]
MIKKLDLAKWRKLLFGHKATSGIFGKTVVYALLIGVSYIFLYPLLKMISMSFLTQIDLVNPEVDWIPTQLSFANYVVANRVLGLLPPSLANFAEAPLQAILGIFSDAGNLFQSLRNIGVVAFVQTVIASLTGFAFARYEFKFKKFWFAMVLLSFVIPLPMVTIPRVMTIFGLQDNVWTPFFNSTLRGTFLDGILKPTLFQTMFPQFLLTLFGQGVNSAILILIFYNFFKMIPISLDEAARIDGATSTQVFWHIYVKLVTPIIITVFLFAFVWNWNDIYSATIYYNSNNPLIVLRLSLFASQFEDLAGSIPGQGGEVRINEAYRMAATFLSMLPLFIMYLAAQRKFIEGIERTGMTGE